MRDKVNDKDRLDLMMEAISNIEEFITGINTLEAFSDDKLKRHAICYNLQCIGENCYKLSREFIREHTGINWKSIEGLRHVLVHDYYNVTTEILWNIITEDLEPLKTNLLEIINTTTFPDSRR